jgi:hypothetical protein
VWSIRTAIVEKYRFLQQRSTGSATTRLRNNFTRFSIGQWQRFFAYYSNQDFLKKIS